jgi:hypothetical protein
MPTQGICSTLGKCLKIGKRQENIDKRKDTRFIFITVVTHPFCLFLVFTSQAISLISYLVQTLFSFQIVYCITIEKFREIKSLSDPPEV